MYIRITSGSAASTFKRALSKATASGAAGPPMKTTTRTVVERKRDTDGNLKKGTLAETSGRILTTL